VQDHGEKKVGGRTLRSSFCSAGDGKGEGRCRRPRMRLKVSPSIPKTNDTKKGSRSEEGERRTKKSRGGL